MNLRSALLFTILSAVYFGGQAGISQSLDAAHAEVKLAHLEKNGELAHPDRTPTEFIEPEINQYLASGQVKLPDGVRSVKFQGQPGVVTSTCLVDFDGVKAGQHSANPMLSLFSGVHNVVVVANARGAGGQGLVEVQSVTLDEVEIPRFVLQLFVEKYLQPKYPNLGMESRFPLPSKVDTATVGLHKLTIIQK